MNAFYELLKIVIDVFLILYIIFFVMFSLSTIVHNFVSKIFLYLLKKIIILFQILKTLFFLEQTETSIFAWFDFDLSTHMIVCLIFPCFLKYYFFLFNDNNSTKLIKNFDIFNGFYSICKIHGIRTCYFLS